MAFSPMCSTGAGQRWQRLGYALPGLADMWLIVLFFHCLGG
jgi:uncharacterized membrane protein YuzA (DUF378 family)